MSGSQRSLFVSAAPGKERDAGDVSEKAGLGTRSALNTKRTSNDLISVPERGVFAKKDTTEEDTSDTITATPTSKGRKKKDVKHVGISQHLSNLILPPREYANPHDSELTQIKIMSAYSASAVSLPILVNMVDEKYVICIFEMFVVFPPSVNSVSVRSTFQFIFHFFYFSSPTY